jgi:hypothetical protein|tara:strand:- start:1664 stop:1837 length:174 start_codon:yes stop_codon:yes gene_type:complete
MKRQPIISERNTFKAKGVTFLIYSTGVVDGLWFCSVKNLTTGERKTDIPYHKIKKYL